MKIAFITMLFCVCSNLLSPAKPSSLHSFIENKNKINNDYCSLFEKLHLSSLGMSERGFDNAINGFISRASSGFFKRANILTIIDFTIPSTRNRMFVIDLINGKLLYQTLVAHGVGSGLLIPTKFSNRPGSLQSSPGFYCTADTYIGKNGLSLKLTGLEVGVNNLASSRAIVLHGANYVSTSFIQAHGYLGRSWGCPAVSKIILPNIIEAIKGGSCMYVYADKSS